MTSPKHGRLVELFRSRPELAVLALTSWLRLTVPKYSRIQVDSGDLTTVKLKDLTADLVVLLHRRRPVLVIVIEVQLRRDPEKLFSWPAYVANQRSRYRCDVLLLVVAPSQSVSRWAARPISLGGGSQIVPHVLGPSTVPLLKGSGARNVVPEFAVLSSISHPSDERAARTALRAIKSLDPDHATLYFELILASITKQLRQHFEELMASGNFDLTPEFGKKYMAKGEAKGKAEGKAEAILAVLDARSLRTTKAQRSRVIECTDLEQLNTWLTRAATCMSASAVFAD